MRWSLWSAYEKEFAFDLKNLHIWRMAQETLLILTYRQNNHRHIFSGSWNAFLIAVENDISKMQSI